MPKKKRSRATHDQLAVLEDAFAVNPLPNADVRNAIAVRTAMTPRSVQVWFQVSLYSFVLICCFLGLLLCLSVLPVVSFGGVVFGGSISGSGILVAFCSSACCQVLSSQFLVFSS